MDLASAVKCDLNVVEIIEISVFAHQTVALVV